MRILVLLPGHAIGGAERVTADLVRCWRRDGHVVDVLAGSARAAAAWGFGGGVLAGLSPSRRWLAPAAAARLVAEVRRGRYDVVYGVHRWPILLARPSRWLAGVPVVFHCHAHVRRRRATWWGDRTVVVSEGVARHVEAAGAAPSRVEVVPNGVDVARLSAAPSRVADIAVTTPRQLRLVTVARLVEGKGVEVLVEAVAQVPDVLLRVVGDGPLREGLARRIERDDLAGRVELTGWLDEPLHELAEADVAIVPSTGREGQALAAIEALAVGRPLVACRVAGVAELVDDEVTGLVVEPGDSASLSRALRRLRDDPDLLRRLQDGAAQQMGRWDASRAAHQVLGVLGEAADG